MMEVAMRVIIAVPLASFVLYFFFSMIDVSFSSDISRTERWNLFRIVFHRPSPLQREIMQEEKEIKDLENQKADMERLDQLRERKDRLWEEVSWEEGKPYKLIYNGTEINRRFETEEEAFNYAEACSDNGLFSAQVERVD